MDKAVKKKTYVTPMVAVVALHVEERLMACLRCPGSGKGGVRCSTGNKSS